MMLRNGDAIEVKKNSVKECGDKIVTVKIIARLTIATKKLINLQGEYPNLKITNVRIKNPDNPAQLHAAKLISYEM